MRRSAVLAGVAALTLVLGACRGEVTVDADLGDDLKTAEVSVRFTGVVASAVSESPELAASVSEVLSERFAGRQVNVSAAGETLNYQVVGGVGTSEVTSQSEVTGVKVLARTKDNRLIVTLVQPTQLVGAIVESGGEDEPLINSVLETTSVAVRIAGAEDATLVQGEVGDVTSSGSHLVVSRPLARVGESTYVFELPGLDPLVLWGSVITACLVAVGAGAAVWRRRRRSGWDLPSV